MFQQLQYGQSDTLPPPAPLTKFSPEVNEILRQKAWVQDDPILAARRLGKQGSGGSSQTSS
jgi:hypothetical protein